MTNRPSFSRKHLTRNKQGGVFSPGSESTILDFCPHTPDLEWFTTTLFPVLLCCSAFSASLGRCAKLLGIHSLVCEILELGCGNWCPDAVGRVFADRSPSGILPGAAVGIGILAGLGMWPEFSCPYPTPPQSSLQIPLGVSPFVPLSCTLTLGPNLHTLTHRSGRVFHLCTALPMSTE